MLKSKKQIRAGSKVLKKKMVKKKRSTEKKVKGENVKLELKPVNGEKETKLDFNTQGAAHQPHSADAVKRGQHPVSHATSYHCK